MLIINEHKSSGYAPRTFVNAKKSDLTVAFAVDLSTSGEKLTHKAAESKYIGFKLYENTYSEDIAEKIAEKMKDLNANTLNIAGNGIYTLNKYNCSQDFINEFVLDVLQRTNNKKKIHKIFNGGQTGVDIAGAVAGIIIGIPVEINIPLGYKQRLSNGTDIYQSKDDYEFKLFEMVKIISNKKNKMKL